MLDPPFTPAGNILHHRMNVPVYVVAIISRSVDGQDRRHRIKFLPHIDGGEKAVPIGYSLRPGTIAPIAAKTGVASSTPDIANAVCYPRHTTRAIGAFVMEEGQSKSRVNAVLHAQAVKGRS